MHEFWTISIHIPNPGSLYQCSPCALMLQPWYAHDIPIISWSLFYEPKPSLCSKRLACIYICKNFMVRSKYMTRVRWPLFLPSYNQNKNSKTCTFKCNSFMSSTMKPWMIVVVNHFIISPTKHNIMYMVLWGYDLTEFFGHLCKFECNPYVPMEYTLTLCGT